MTENCGYGIEREKDEIESANAEEEVVADSVQIDHCQENDDWKFPMDENTEWQVCLGCVEKESASEDRHESRDQI